MKFAVLTALIASSAASYLAIKEPSGSITPLGSFETSESGQTEVVAVSDLTSIPHEACVGVVGSNNKFTCHSVFNYESESIGFKVFTDAAGKVVHVNAVPDKSGVSIVSAQEIPGPKVQWSKKTQAKGDFIGETNAESTEEKSFFQKYWYYIVPLGLVLIVNSGNAPAQG